MRTLRKIIAGAFLSLGFMFLLVSVVAIFNPDHDPEESVYTFMGGLMLGIPLTAIGGYMVIGLRHDHRRTLAATKASIEKDLEWVLLQMVEENDGKVAAIQFALIADLTYDRAKEFLDQKAIQLDADFDVDEKGRIYYSFPL
jgi:hypothetical protein